MPIVDMTPRVCESCGVADDEERVRPCPICGILTCKSCTNIFSDTLCAHTPAVFAHNEPWDSTPEDYRRWYINGWERD